MAVRDVPFMLPAADRVDAGTVDGFCQLDDPSPAVGYSPHDPGDVLRRVFEFGMRQRPRCEQPARGPQARLEQMPARFRDVGAGHRERGGPVRQMHRDFQPAVRPPVDDGLPMGDGVFGPQIMVFEGDHPFGIPRYPRVPGGGSQVTVGGLEPQPFLGFARGGPFLPHCQFGIQGGVGEPPRRSVGAVSVRQRLMVQTLPQALSGGPSRRVGARTRRLLFPARR